MTAPFVIREQSFAEQIQPGVQILMSALAARHQNALDLQKLKLAQQETEARVAQAGAATAESRARTKGLLQEQKLEIERLEAESLGLAKFAELATSPDGLSEGAIARAQTELKNPAAVEAFNKQITAQQQREQQRITARKGTVEADVLEQTADTKVAMERAQLATEQRRAEALRLGVQAARELMSDPNAKVPTDPTVAQAVGMASLGAGSILSDTIRSAMQTAGSNAQSAMLMRQLAVDAYRGAWQETMTELEIGSNRNPNDILNEALERRATSLGLPGGAKQLQEIVRSVFDQFSQGYNSFGNPAVPSPESMEQLKPVLNSPAFLKLSPADQVAVTQAAHKIVAGEARMPTVQELKALGVENPAKVLSFLRAAVQVLGRQQQRQQPRQPQPRGGGVM